VPISKNELIIAKDGETMLAIGFKSNPNPNPSKTAHPPLCHGEGIKIVSREGIRGARPL
jgi:hypothetical protein